MVQPVTVDRYWYRFVFFSLCLANQTHRARSGSLTTNGSRAADLDEAA